RPSERSALVPARIRRSPRRGLQPFTSGISKGLTASAVIDPWPFWHGANLRQDGSLQRSAGPVEQGPGRKPEECNRSTTRLRTRAEHRREYRARSVEACRCGEGRCTHGVADRACLSEAEPARSVQGVFNSCPEPCPQ